MRSLILIGLALLAGCSTTSGVLKTSSDSYTVSASSSYGAGGASTAKASAYNQANQECTKQGKTILVTSENANVPSWNDGMYKVDLTFKCQ